MNVPGEPDPAEIERQQRHVKALLAYSRRMALVTCGGGVVTLAGLLMPAPLAAGMWIGVVVVVLGTLLLRRPPLR